MALMDSLDEAIRNDGKVDGWLTPVIEHLKELLSRREQRVETEARLVDSDMGRFVQEHGSEMSDLRSDGTQEDFLGNYRKAAADGAGGEDPRMG